jgi:hypothetical protein
VRSAGRLTLVLALLTLSLSTGAAAQETPPLTVEGLAGWIGFPDDGAMVGERLAGASLRWYASPRVSFGPEFVFISGSNHSHLVLTGNVTYDLRSPAAGQLGRISPFIVAGGGLYQTRDEFFNGTFTSSEGAFTVGGGIRSLVSQRVTLGLDVRVGWELHLRVNGLVGIHIGR